MADLGYFCGCGHWNKADVWAAAHWHIPINHVCDCGRVNTIKSGRVITSSDSIEVPAPRKKRTRKR